MFSSSVRRVALTAPPTSSLSSGAPRTAASQILSYRSHQRRCSSSKPSSPADGSKGISEGQSVPATSAQARANSDEKIAEGQVVPVTPVHGSLDSEKKGPTRNSRRKAKDNERVKERLPSVPSTQHISPKEIYASTFFSLHRPISPTVNFPKAITNDAFAAIFTSRMKTNTKPSEVISTLSNTLEQLDSATTNLKQLNLGPQQSQWNSETDELRAAITAESYRKAELKHLDKPPSDSFMDFPQHILSGRYQPFRPPPAPLPIDTAESLAAGAEAVESQAPQHRTYTAVVTIEESTDENGDVTYTAHSSPLVAEERSAANTPFLGRMRIRQARYKEYREKRAEEPGMEAISVKRIRRLKMKKHKYKKLMKKTRNLRQRLNRL